MKLRENINNLKVFSTEEGLICGLYFDYDNTVKSKVIMKNLSCYNTVIDIKLSIINSSSQKENMISEESVKDDDMVDYITHIIGRFSNKIEFIGFKTANGKFFFYGNPNKGEPFLIGKFNEKFHRMKVGFNSEGICYIKTYFKPTLFSSTVPVIDTYYAEPYLIDDEEIIDEFTDEKEIEYALYFHDEDDE